MNEGGPPPPPKNDTKPKTIHIQVSNHLDLILSFYVSPKALALLCALGGCAGGAWGYLQR